MWPEHIEQPMTHSCVTLWYHPSSTRLLWWTSDDFDLSPWNFLGTVLSRMSLLISSSFRYWKVSLWVMPSAHQTQPLDCSRMCCGCILLTLSHPHHTPGPTEWLPLFSVCSSLPESFDWCKWLLQGNIFCVGMLRVQTFHLTYCDMVFVFFIVSVQNIAPLIMSLCT